MKLAQYRAAQRIMRGRKGRTSDRRRRNRRITTSFAKWKSAPNMYDIRGIDTPRRNTPGRRRRVTRKRTTRKRSGGSSVSFKTRGGKTVSFKRR